MKYLPLLLVPVCLLAQVNLDTISDNGIAAIQPTNQFPVYGGDVKCAIDTSGYAYMMGGCTYLGAAEGTHNADVFRINIKTGRFDLLYNNATDPYPGGCQSGHAYDPTRNCVWFGNGGGSSLPACQVWKFQCPDGPITKYSDTTLGSCFSGANANYWHFDTTNDLLIGVGAYGLSLFYPATRDTHFVPYPYQSYLAPYEIPTCFDTKRGLVAITLAQVSWYPSNDTGVPANNIRDIWFFNTTSKTWSKKSPVNVPPLYRCEMTYDSRNDKYIYFGSGFDFCWIPGASCETQIWAYDPVTNAWEKMDPAGRAFNHALSTASTWPAARMKGAWAYSEKYNVCMNWGGGVYGFGLDVVATADCQDVGLQNPLWLYRYAGGAGTSVESRKPEGRSFEIVPNPFNPSTTIRFNISGAAVKKAEVSVFDASGRCIRKLSAECTGGNGAVEWNGRDDLNRTAGSGVYLYKVSVGKRSFLEKGLLLK
jgi:hypothetical protein